MARATGGLTPHQAALLLRSQRQRNARLRAEQGRLAVLAADAEVAAGAAEAAARKHAQDTSAAIKRAYATLVGQAVDPLHVLGIRDLESASAEDHAHLQQELAAAAASAREAALEASAAQQRRIACARQLARRERLFELTAQNVARVTAASSESQADEAHLALLARRR